MLDVNSVHLNAGNLVEGIANRFGIGFQVSGLGGVVGGNLHQSTGGTLHRTEIQVAVGNDLRHGDRGRLAGDQSDEIQGFSCQLFNLFLGERYGNAYLYVRPILPPPSKISSLYTRKEGESNKNFALH